MFFQGPFFLGHAIWSIYLEMNACWVQCSGIHKCLEESTSIHDTNFPSESILKGHVDKYNIYLCFFKINQHHKLQPIRPIYVFSFYHFFFFFLWTASSSECLIGLCIVYLLKLTSKNRNCYKYKYFSKSELNLNVKFSMQSLPTFYANSSFDKIISIFLKNNGGWCYTCPVPL